ncbi:MAG: hypothetical protein ED557_00085 [Balneola sp.]|nr:MAG: hypothetical protein ED557_00085 [Balneola sp.]
MKKALFYLATLSFFGFFILIYFFKVDTSQENSVAITGVVTNIIEGPSYDIVFKLEGDDTRYYINRGIEQGFNVEELQDELLGVEIELWVAQNPISNPRHITHLTHGTIAFSEW